MAELTEDQELVANSDGYVMCCALPGSGKSHTMISLAKNLVMKDRENRLLLITFTKAAALELNERLAKAISGNSISRVKAATFDSIFGQQVRQNSRNRKRTLVGGEQYNFLERAMRHVGISMDITEAMSWIDIYGRMLKPEPINDQHTSPGWLIYEGYIDLLKENNCQDFNLIARTAYLSVQNGAVPPWNATHILVDEFQDTSDMQYAWIRLHGEMGSKIVVVGDDDQSIYSWRGAIGYQNLLNFQHDFDATGYILKKCFRCRPEILAAARSLIEHNEDRVYKEMVSARETGGKVFVTGYPSIADEFQAIINKVLSNNKQWAILARTNRILDVVEGYFKLNGIEYKRLGGKKLWDDNVANIILKLLWSLVRPKDTRFIPEILGWLGEDEEVIQLVAAGISGKGNDFGSFMKPDWLDWCSHTEQLHLHWNEWGTETSNKEWLLARVRAITHFLKSARGKDKKAARIIELVGDIIVNMNNVYGGFVARVEVLSKNLAPAEKQEKEVEKGVVTLATLHASKGLQWEQVWICSSNQGTCPSNNALEDNASAGIAEERRLFYVGMTRAIDELYLSYSLDMMGTSPSQEPSQFLSESCPDLLAASSEKLKNIVYQKTAVMEEQNY